jgi:arylformamidase
VRAPPRNEIRLTSEREHGQCQTNRKALFASIANRNRGVFLIAAAALSAALASQTSACAPIPNLVDEYTAAYGADEQSESVDVYLPDDAHGEPLIVFVHGGAWASGDKSQYVDLGNAFAQCGVGFAILNYPIAPDVRSADQALEIARAFRWVRDRAGPQTFAVDRMYLMGHSSGAQLVVYVEAGASTLLSQVGLTQGDIAGVIAVDGAGYEPSIETRGIGLNPARLLAYSRAFGNDPAGWKPYDVAQYLTGHEPPTLIVHAEQDYIAPEFESADFAAALQQAGDTVTYLQFADRDHFSVLKGMTDGAGDPAFEAILQFVER